MDIIIYDLHSLMSCFSNLCENVILSPSGHNFSKFWIIRTPIIFKRLRKQTALFRSGLLLCCFSFSACDDCGKWGNCDDGIQGSGKCVCRQGWTGENCQLEIRE